MEHGKGGNVTWTALSLGGVKISLKVGAHHRSSLQLVTGSRLEFKHVCKHELAMIALLLITQMQDYFFFLTPSLISAYTKHIASA